MAVVVGTSGYDYPEWVGEKLFYPSSLVQRRRDWLTYYASQFPAIELNFTYYGATNPRQVEGMLHRVEPEARLSLLEGDFNPRPDFTFIIKAYATLTHNITNDWRMDARHFREDIHPLIRSGKLTAVLAQFPSRFRMTTKTATYCVRLAEELAPVQLVVEPRSQEWFTPMVRNALAERGVVMAGVDAPDESRMPRALEYEAAGGDDITTSLPLNYVRMHGRREGSWWSGDAASRYEYRYSDTQLDRFARRLAAAQPEAQTFVMFNNHRHAEAALNAKRLTELLDRELTGI